MADSDTGNRLFAAVYDPATWVFERTLFARHRSWLVEDLHGTVLDLGSGTGAMFPYYARAMAADPEIELRAVEPDQHMRRRANERARELGVDVTVRPDRAEDLSDPDDSVDVLVSALVLCTVDDPGAAIDEVARALRPGGEFRFLEHVHAGGVLARAQTALAPAWERLAAGCHLDRSPGERLHADDRFEVTTIEGFRAIPPAEPLIRGIARRRED